LLRGLRQLDAAVRPLQTAADLWDSLAREDSKVAAYRANQARCLGVLSDVFRRLNRSDDANVAFQSSLQLHEKLVVEFADVREYRVDLALRLNQSGRRLASEGELEGARQRSPPTACSISLS
jgi:hypothetical protein